jgi:hypothetical protein
VLSRAVTAPHRVHAEPAERGARELTFAQAVNEALAQEMERDDSVFVMGEDVAETGGIFQATKGLVERFGRARVRDTADLRGDVSAVPGSAPRSPGCGPSSRSRSSTS